MELYIYVHMPYVRIEQSRSTDVHVEIKRNKLCFFVLTSVLVNLPPTL